MGMTSSALRPYVADWYNKVFIPAYNDLEEETKAVYCERGYKFEARILDSKKWKLSIALNPSHTILMM